ncbi:MAG: hypothetical protein LBS10_06040, partial [Gracilibacteraceae bacterium]|nr:hypothetical protein [Gracilibacteraceae bacterium]
EAERQVRELYRMSEIVLSSDDYMQTDFEAIDIEAQ